MKSQIRIRRLFLPAALALLSAAIFTALYFVSQVVSAAPQQPAENGNKINARPGASGQKTPVADEPPLVDDGTRYTYEFRQPEFHLRRILIEHDSTGQAQVTFERLNEEIPIVEKFQMSRVTLAKIKGLYDALQFLDSNQDYQSDKQFPHLGTMRITMERGPRKRTAEFNWSNVDAATELVTEYRRIADQVVFVFDLTVSRENQPLNSPKLMQGLETLLNRNGIADPKQLIPLLREVSTDEHLPLIARNHALRLIKKIEK